MNVKIINGLSEIEKNRDKWLRLESKADLKYYSTFEYLKYWMEEVISNDNELFIVVVENEDEFCAIAPLYIEKRKTKIVEIKELKFIGIGDYFDFIIDESKKHSLFYKLIFDEIEKNSSKYDRINLSYIYYKSKLSNYMLSNDNLNSFLKYLVEIPKLDFSNYNTVSNLNISKNMKNYRNRLFKNTNYNLEILTGNEIEENLFNNISSIHRKEQEYLNRKKGRRDRYSILSEDFKGDIYRKLIIGNKNIIIFLLRNDEQEVIVYKICYFYNDEYYEWNTGYDYKYYEYRPNNTLYIEIFKKLLNSKFKGIYDFGAGRYPWKYRWANTNSFVYEYDRFISDKFKIKLYNKLRKLKEII